MELGTDSIVHNRLIAYASDIPGKIKVALKFGIRHMTKCEVNSCSTTGTSNSNKQVLLF